jgi:polar amino acid transport system permease protein
MMPDLLQRYGLKLLEGLLVTLELVSISIVLGAILAIPITAGRLSKNRIISGIAFGYVYFFRGTPLLAQLFLIYYGAGQFVGPLKAVGLWGFLREALNCALLAFALNTAAYQAEIYRGAIRSVSKGQWEAAQALGLHSFPILLKVILPQAAIVALRPLGNEIILMVKGSAVASIVTVFDLMGQTKLAFSRSYDLTIYLYAAVLYLAVVEVIRRLWNRLDARLTRHLRLDKAQNKTVAADLVPATR